MNRSGWLTFSAVVLIIAGVMRVIDAIWAFGYHGAIPDNLQGALLGHSLATYGWVWLITGVILIAAGILVLGPSDKPSAEVSRWIGIRWCRMSSRYRTGPWCDRRTSWYVPLSRPRLQST